VRETLKSKLKLLSFDEAHGKAPAHALLVRLQLVERRAGHGPEHHVVVREVDGEPVEAVGKRRARRTASRVVGPEHEAVDEELRTSAEQVGELLAAFVRLEHVLLVEPDLAAPSFRPPHRRWREFALIYSVLSTAKAMLTVVLKFEIRPSSTSALIETTSAPVMPRTVFAASCTASSAALANDSDECPITWMTFATGICPPWSD
jgi:hypothetical protein